MDFSQQFLIDMAVNMGGYLLAGLVSVVIYSLLHRQRHSAAAAETTPNEVPGREAASKPSAEKETRRIEFIKLDERPNTDSAGTAQEAEPNAASVGDRRNRAEIIRIARTMLKAGASEEKIKRLIPVSDAELSLLSMSKS